MISSNLTPELNIIQSLNESIKDKHKWIIKVFGFESFSAMSNIDNYTMQTIGNVVEISSEEYLNEFQFKLKENGLEKHNGKNFTGESKLS